ncbi:response regulator transcription factor [Devosia oryziradicis]|uniref:Response regulator transcription factor n=1 Tax=Devosia oryziradicis TaxID=2801335 RepID=A0ABX7C007_9HYPH|nr:response regulator transcription factor [Devosia oryziradicis]QQR37123.1 response regulator transcription factor [Devosia oryziradicis]
MTSRVHSIAILAANPAFSSILADMLQAERGHRVPCFTEVEALTTFMVISPVDIVLLDADAEGGRELAQQLRHQPRLANPFVQIVALTRANPAFHRPLLAAGADLVLPKPVAPARLLAAVDGLLIGEQRSVVNWVGPALSAPTETRPLSTDNVVQLFPRRQD